MDSSFKDIISRSNEEARACREESERAAGDQPAVKALLKRYIGCKYLLDESEMASEDIASLSKASVDKLLATHRKETLQDVSSVCAGSSSASTKKVLLIMSIQKGLGIRFDAKISGSIKTIDDLTREVCSRLRNR